MKNEIRNIVAMAGREVPASEKKIRACGNAISVDSLVSSVKATSYRATAGVADTKITAVAKVIDFLYGKKIFVLSDSNSVVVDVNGECRGYIRKNTQQWDCNPTKLLMLIGDVLYTLIHESNEELRGCFRKIASLIGKKEASDEVAFFCDSYYYYRKEASVEVTSDLILEPVQAAYRRGLLVDTFIGKLIPLSDESSIISDKDYAGEEEKEKKETPEMVLADCKAGKYKIPYKWKEQEYIYSPALLDNFVPTETFVNILKKITFRLGRILNRMEEGADRVAALGQDYVNLTLTGKPGTGKTAMVYAISAATGLPVYTTAGSHNTDEDEFEGKTKMVDGKPSAVPTDALKCFEDGGIFLIEEANLPQAAVIMGALGQAVEFPFILKKNGYETIRRHPLCIFVTTMNVGTVGAKAMSQPFANRFKQSYVLNDPGSKVFIDILSKRTGEDRKLCRWVYDAYEAILKCLDKNDVMADIESIKLALSMRSCMGAIENIQEGEHPKDAVRDSIIGKIAEQDLEMSEICLRAIDALPDYR